MDISVTPKSVSTPVDMTYVADNIHPIASMLGLDTHNLSDSDQSAVAKIYEFIRGDAKEMTELEVLHQVRELENRLGMTNLGERRLDKVYRYVKLQSQIDRLSNARDRELR